MQTSSNYQHSVEEKLIWWGLVYTYPVYAIGGLYITGSALGWLILGLAGLRCFVNGKEKTARITPMVWVWIISMLVMLVSLLVAHSNWSLGMGQTIKSSVGWAKGWALLAVFPLIGAVVNIRREMLIRGVCVLAKHTSFFAAFTFICYLVKIPGLLFISPLQAVGGPGENFFMVSLYGLNPETGAGRWQFFGPWAPAAGFLSCIYLVFCLQEQDKKWRYWGIAGCTLMVLLSQSRAGLAIFAIIFPLTYFSDKFKNPYFLLFLGIVIPSALILGEPLYHMVMDTYQQVKEARPDSTRVRAALENIALQRWQAEAPIWGHGIVESGPKLVEFMPIGSHHSWFGLLFVKGLVGLFALAIPVGMTAIYLLVKAQASADARTALCLLAVFVCYSFFENLEILSYLYWPALIWIGIALNPAKIRGQNV